MFIDYYSAARDLLSHEVREQCEELIRLLDWAGYCNPDELYATPAGRFRVVWAPGDPDHECETFADFAAAKTWCEKQHDRDNDPACPHK